MKQPLLFDTSVWIDSIRQKSTPASELLTYYMQHDYEIPLIPTIVQELLQGIRHDAQHQKIKGVLKGYTKLEITPMAAAIGASNLFRSLRKKGVTIKKNHDGMIAYYAISFNLELVHNDSDFDLISAHSPLKIWKNNKG